jgi:hypothetical protein
MAFALAGHALPVEENNSLASGDNLRQKRDKPKTKVGRHVRPLGSEFGRRSRAYASTLKIATRAQVSKRDLYALCSAASRPC